MIKIRVTDHNGRAQIAKFSEFKAFIRQLKNDGKMWKVQRRKDCSFGRASYIVQIPLDKGQYALKWLYVEMKIEGDK